MPQRNDRTLYTGMTQATQRVLERREVVKQAKRQQQSVLKPAEQRIKDFIEKQRVDQIMKLAEMVEMDTTTEDIKSEIRAIKKNLTFIDGFKTQIETMLRIRERESSDE